MTISNNSTSDYYYQDNIVGERKNQEDYSLISKANDKEILFILADGMGGHTSGEIASEIAVKVFESTFVNYFSNSINVKLNVALQQANNQITLSIKSKPELDGMGCTLIAAHIGAEGLNWISVGDSLLYVFRNNKLLKLNADHSMAPIILESYRQGKISKEEAENHPNKNALQSALMGHEISLIDSPEKAFKLLKNDVVLVSSDGILSLDDSEIIHSIKKNTSFSAENIVNQLLQLIKTKNKPRQDNTTIQVLIVTESTIDEIKYPILNSKKFLSSIFLFMFFLSLLIIFKNNITETVEHINLSSSTNEATVRPQPIPIPVVNEDAISGEKIQGVTSPENVTPINKKSPIINPKKDKLENKINHEKKEVVTDEKSPNDKKNQGKTESNQLKSGSEDVLGNFIKEKEFENKQTTQEEIPRKENVEKEQFDKSLITNINK